MFGFEIKIMDKYVCGKQPRISSGLLCEITVRAASAPLTYHTWTAYALQTRSMCEPGVKGHLTYSS